MPLATLLADLGHPLNMRCGGRGLCTGCQVQLQSGNLRHIATGKVITAADEEKISSCQYSACVEGSAHIVVPITSQLGHSAQIVDEFKIRVPVAQAPLFDSPGLSVAIDIGTTTVAVLLVESGTGRVLGRASSLNQQTVMGDNVITRINHCMLNKQDIGKLQRLIFNDTILPLLKQACTRANRTLADLSGIVVSGNTTMLHLLAGIDPSTMGVSPFTPVFLEHRCLSVADLGVESELDPALPIHLLPGLSAYVGADINSGIVATGMHYEDGPNLLVDIGTNGEIALKHGDRLLGCATAAGPAFEGAGLTWGIQAVDGAISKIKFETDPFSFRFERIHGRSSGRCPGICGSAYLDFLGEGIRSGVLTASGRFSKEFISRNPALIQTVDGGNVFILLPQGSQPEESIGISECDISRLLQAKAAIAAGILTLLSQAGLESSDIRKLYLAGGFGLHLNVENAISCGLLPGFKTEQVEVVGNTSLAGAYMTVQDRGVLEELRLNQRRVEVVELNLDPSFEDCYIENLLLEAD